MNYSHEGTSREYDVVVKWLFSKIITKFPFQSFGDLIMGYFNGYGIWLHFRQNNDWVLHIIINMCINGNSQATLFYLLRYGRVQEEKREKKKRGKKPKKREKRGKGEERKGE